MVNHVPSEYDPKFANNYTDASQAGTQDSKSNNKMPSPSKSSKQRSGFSNRIQPKTSKKAQPNHANSSQ